MLTKNKHNKILWKNNWNFPLAYKRIIHCWGSKEHAHPLTELLQTSSNESHPFPCSAFAQGISLNLFHPQKPWAPGSQKRRRLENLLSMKLLGKRTQQDCDTARGKKILILLVEGNAINKLGQTEVTPNYRCPMSVLLM